jgi:tetratricopeptide (TPR) repeat protein
MILLMVLGGCGTTEADKKSLQEGYALYGARKLDQSEAVATKFIEKNPDSPNVDEALYLRALSRLSRGGSVNRVQAAEDLRQAIARTQRPDLKAKAYRALADIDFDAMKWKEAREGYEKAMAGAPAKGPLMSYLDYRIGACYQAVGEWDKSRPYFQKVAADNADAYLVERSVVRMYAQSYALQFGAFQEGPKAAELVNALKGNGIAATIVSEMREGKLLYMVRSGSYKTWAEADGQRDRMLARYPLVTIVP